MNQTLESDRLERLGFRHLSEETRRLQARKRKLAVAYEHYRYVREERILEFNKKLSEKTYNKKERSWQVLEFCTVANYSKLPPEEALIALEAAQSRGCFDAFEIASIQEVKDPILFGRIEGCSDRFFIAQWDDDVKIEDLLMQNEG